MNTLTIFGERTATAVVSVAGGMETVDRFDALARQYDIPRRPIGIVSGDKLVIDTVRGGSNLATLPVANLRAAYEGAIPAAMGAGAGKLGK